MRSISEEDETTFRPPEGLKCRLRNACLPFKRNAVRSFFVGISFSCLSHLARLASGPEALPLELHSFNAFEGDDGVQGCATAFEPAVGQEPRRAAVDFLALWVRAAPALILAARPSRVAHDHKAVLALV